MGKGVGWVAGTRGDSGGLERLRLRLYLRCDLAFAYDEAAGRDTQMLWSCYKNVAAVWIRARELS